jgi:hypothetical protein
LRVPRSGDHEADVTMVRRSVREIGALEFRILANATDDGAAFDAIWEWFDHTKIPEEEQRERLADWQRLAQLGLPPRHPARRSALRLAAPRARLPIRGSRWAARSVSASACTTAPQPTPGNIRCGRRLPKRGPIIDRSLSRKEDCC